MSSDIKKPYILTHSGVKFILRSSGVDGFKLGDIAHSLSMQCRYTGHTKLFYSVAEHCVLMSRYVEDPDCKIVALYHDAVEAYVGDLATPLKQCLPEYKVIEEEVEQRLFTWLGYNPPPRVKKLVKMLDTRIMLRERNVLLPDRGHWIEDEVVTPLDIDIECWSPARAKKEYLKQADKMMTLIRS
jgi:hypothetical protein